MANIRTLKLNLLADTTDFADGIKKASGQTESFSSSVKSSMKTLAKSAAIAGAAVAGMAVAFGVDAVKAALVDEKSQRRLAKALQNTTKASAQQIKGVEKYIAKTSLASGVIDDDLRPSFQKLVQSTKDIGKAQDLMTLALDTSAASGKNLETVSLALAKGYGGNNASLGRLGLGLDKATLKSKDFKVVQEKLEKIVSGQSKAKANSFEGRIERFKIAIDEAKESIGYAILEQIEPFVDKWLPKIAEGVQDVIDGFQGKGGKGSGVSLGEAIRNVTDAMGEFFAAFNESDDGKQRSVADNITAIANAFNALAGAITKISGAYSSIKKFENSPLFEKYLSKVPLFYGLQISKWEQEKLFGDSGKPKKALGGPVSKGKSYLVGEYGPELFTPMGGGNITPNSRLNGGGVTIIMNGIVDGESARRSIERVLQQSSIRTGVVNVNGVAL